MSLKEYEAMKKQMVADEVAGYKDLSDDFETEGDDDEYEEEQDDEEYLEACQIVEDDEEDKEELED